MLRGARALGFATRASVFRMSTDPIWTENALADLRREFGDAYAGRTVLVTGADGFMGSHLTDALVEIGADVHAFVRATSSGALNNISHLRNRLKVKFADLTDKTSIDYLVKELRDTVSDKPYVFHLGAQAHVGESWHRPYETVMANTIGTLNLLQSVVDWGLELEKFDTAGTSEEYGNVRENVAHHHDFDDAGGLILHERSPINPKSIYATAKVAADFLTMNYHDAFGVPGVVTRMFNNYGPRQNPRYVTGTIITQALTRPGIELGRARAAARLLLLHRRRPRPPHRRREGRSRRRLRLRPGLEHLDGRLGRPDPAHRRRARLLARRPPHRHRREPPAARRHRRDGAARRLREAEPRDRLGAEGVVGGRRPADDPVVRRAPRPLDRTRRLARPGRRPRVAMSVAHEQEGVLRRDELVERGGIFHRTDADEHSDYRQRWEGEAAEDHVRSAIATGQTERVDYGTLTGKIAPVWQRFPRGRHFGTVLEIGAGYGRIPLYLARERDVTWSTYCAVDISATMLERFVEYRDQFAPAPESRLYPICVSADALPLEDDSVDLAITSAVFLHMGKRFVRDAVAEIARTLKPGGDFVFDVSFPNAHNPTNLLLRLKPERFRPPHFMKFWTRGEVESLLAETGLAAKAGGLTIEPGAYAVLPKRVGPVPVPLARRANSAVQSPPQRFEDVLAESFLVTSNGLAA